MEVTDAKRLMELARENTDLKMTVVEQALDFRLLTDVISRNWRALQNSGVVTDLRNSYEISECRACRELPTHRSNYRYFGQRQFVNVA